MSKALVETFRRILTPINLTYMPEFCVHVCVCVKDSFDSFYFAVIDFALRRLLRIVNTEVD